MTVIGYTPIHISPYRAGVCWFGIRAAEADGPQRFCGAGAGRYRISRTTENGFQQQGVNLLSRSTEVQEVWLCYKHVTVMERRGYCCHTIEE